jgi:glycosyltransferase involved in cell wall biosynthesis
MNIVLVSSLLIPKSIGGIEVFTMLLSHALTHEGHTVTIFTGGEGSVRQDEKVTIIEIPELQLPLHLKSFFMPYYAKRIQKRLSQEERIKKADIINAVDLDSIISLAGDSSISQKFIATIHDYGLVCANGLLLYGTQVCPNYCHCGKGFLCLKKRKLNIFQEAYLQVAYNIRKTYRDKQLGKIHNAICVSKFVAAQIAPIAPHIHTDIIGNCLPQTWWKEKHENTTKNIDILYPGRFESFK